MRRETTSLPHSHEQPPQWWRQYSQSPGLLAHLRTNVLSGSHGDQTFLTWLDARGCETSNLSYVELWARAEAVARAMRYDKQVVQGERVLALLCPWYRLLRLFLGLPACHDHICPSLPARSLETRDGDRQAQARPRRLRRSALLL